MKFKVPFQVSTRHTGWENTVCGFRVPWFGSRNRDWGPVTTASAIAKHILGACKAKQDFITNLKLQKLLYYAQAWHLAIYGEPLFPDRIEAWVHGPVVPSVFREYRSFRWSPIWPTPDDDVFLSSREKAHLEAVLEEYGKFDASSLERMTHAETPWINARAGLAPDASSNNEISHDSMRLYYQS